MGNVLLSVSLWNVLLTVSLWNSKCLSQSTLPGLVIKVPPSPYKVTILRRNCCPSPFLPPFTAFLPSPVPIEYYLRVLKLIIVQYYQSST